MVCRPSGGSGRSGIDFYLIIQTTQQPCFSLGRPQQASSPTAPLPSSTLPPHPPPCNHGSSRWTLLPPWALQVELETASLREKEELNEKWGRVLRVAQTERVGLESKAAALRDRCAALKERRRKLEQDVDRSRAQFSTSGGRYFRPQGPLPSLPPLLDWVFFRDFVAAVPDPRGGSTYVYDDVIV